MRLSQRMQLDYHRECSEFIKDNAKTLSQIMQRDYHMECREIITANAVSLNKAYTYLHTYIITKNAVSLLQIMQ